MCLGPWNKLTRRGWSCLFKGNGGCSGFIGYLNYCSECLTRSVRRRAAMFKRGNRTREKSAASQTALLLVILLSAIGSLDVIFYSRWVRLSALKDNVE